MLPDARLPFALFAVVLAIACAPRAGTLGGAPAPSKALPNAELSSGFHKVVFDWDYSEPELVIRGDGAVRTAHPDSARLDLFLRGGLGGGQAVMIGDTLRAPHVDVIRRYLPPPPMLWAVLGRLALPPAKDTTARVAGDTLRADIGEWRITFVANSLRRVERMVDGRINEFVERDGQGNVRYFSHGPRRELKLKIKSDQAVGGFDRSIWSVE
jgi:hypothetical protein